MTTRNPTHIKPLSAWEAKRAVYIDFEGHTDQSPVLLGTLHASGSGARRRWILRHHILDDAFFALPDGACGFDGGRYEVRRTHLSEAMHGVVLWAAKHDRPIVAWSSHENAVVERLLHEADFARFDFLFRDAKETTRRWYRERCPDSTPRRGGNTLAFYQSVFGLEVEPRLGPRLVGDNLRRVRSPLDLGKDWAAFTDKQRTAWVDVLEHNAADCTTMRDIVLATAE